MSDQKLSEEFKETIKSFLKEFKCPTASSEVDEDVETFQDLFWVLENNSEEICSAIFYEKECSSCSEKDDEIDKLEDKVVELEEKIDKMEDFEYELGEIKEEQSKSFFPETLIDFYKLQCFIEHKDKYSISDFEDLFK